MTSTVPNWTFSDLTGSMAIRTSTIGLVAVAVAAAFLLIAMPTHAQTGDITTVAGGGVGDGGKPTLAALSSPDGLAIDSRGDVYIADGAANRIRKIDVQGNVITTFAGTGNQGFSGDGGHASAAELNSPFGDSPSTTMTTFTLPTPVTTESEKSTSIPES